ncbi:E3 ubiquitin-protein ligase HUWE1, related, partial [Eimeria tenella]
PEGAATAGEEQRPRLRDLPVDLLNALPAAVRQAAVAGCRDRDSVEEGAAAPGADVDNATFLATLEPALRQEVLLTADALVLEALPRELQVEAALLRERAMQRQQQRQQQQQRAAAAAAAAAANITAGAAGGAPPAGDRPGRGSRGTSSGPGGASGSGGPSLPAAFVDASLALFGGFEGRWGPLGGPHSSTGARLLGMPASSLLPRSIRLGLREALLDDAVFSREGEGPRGAAAGGDAAASLIAARGMLQSSAAARSAAAGGPASGAAAAAAAARGPVFAGMPEELLLLPSERLLRAPAALSAPPGLTGFSGLSGLVAFPNRTGGGTRFRVSQGAGGLAGSLGSAAEAAGGAFRQIDFLSLLLNGGAAAVATNGAAAAAPQALSEDLWVGFLTAAAGGGGGPHGGPWSGGGGPPGGPHRGPGRSSGGANGGPPFDSSPLSIPGLMGVCRVLFLSRGVNKRLLFLLLASLAASHAETRDVLLLLLVYICWVAIPECYTTLRPSYPGRDTLKLLGLPPVPVLLPPEGSQQQQQQQHQQQQQQGGFQCERFAMGGAAAERVLEQLRSLLTVLPQAAATFCTKMPHPRSLTFQDLLKVQQRRHNASSSSSSSHHSPQQQQGEAKSEGAPPAATAQRTEQQQQQPQQQQHHHEGAAEGGEDLAHELRRKKKRREPCSSTGTSKDEGAAASVLQQQNEPLEEPVDGEYLINVLMQLTATSLFQTSPRHMAHLLAAIHLLVSGSASSSSSSSNSSSRSRPPSRSSAPASSSRAQSTDSQGQPSSSSSSSAAAPGSSSSASAAVPSSGSSTAAVAPGSSSGNSAEPAVEEIVPDNALSSSSSSSNSSSSSAQESMQERMLRVVTPEAVECICGLLCSPHVAAAWSQVVGFSAQQREAQLQQLAVVAKIVGCLYTSAQHRGWVDEALRRNCDALSDVLSQELAALSRTLNEAAQQQQQLQVHDDLWARREALEPHFAAFYRLCGTLNEVYTHLQQQQQQQLQQQQAKSPDAAAGSATEEPAGAASAAAPQAAAVPAVAGAAANQVPPPAASLNADIDLSSAPEAPAAAAAPPAAAAAGAAAAANADESSTAVVPALVRFRAFFDASKVHKIWEGLEDVLSAVGAAYPALSAEAAATQHRHRTQQAAAAAAAAEATAASAAAAAGSAGAASGAATARPAGTDAAAGEARAREAAGGEAAADGAAAAAAAEDGEGAVVEEREAAAAGSRELAAPLVLAQLLPLFEAFLQVQQLSIAADLGLKDVSMLQELDLFAAAAERERSIADRAAAAVAAAVDPRTGIPDAAAAQAACCRASEELLQCEKQEEDGGGFGVSSRRHLALCCFCERHVLCFNALLKQNPSLLSGPFSPLLRLTPMMLSFENKRHYFRQKIKEIRHASRADHVRLSVRRQHVFTDSYHQIRIRS